MKTCHDIEQMWDDARDGAIAVEQRSAFDEHMHQCDHCRQLFEAETQWLTMIAEPDADTNNVGAASEFANRVMNDWESSRTAVIGRIGWDVARVALAAAAVMALGVTMWLVGRPDPTVQPKHIVDGGENTVSTQAVASLVSNIGRRYSQGTEVVLRSIDRPDDALNLDGVVAFLTEFPSTIPVPDPAAYIENGEIQ